MYLTLIGYKQDSADYCRGCVMERFGSDLVTFGSEDPEQIIQKWAELEARKRKLGEAGYECTLLINGKGQDAWDYEEQTFADELYAKAEALKATLIKEREEAEAKAEAVRKQRDAEAKERAEREQLAKLLQKYP